MPLYSVFSSEIHGSAVFLLGNEIRNEDGQRKYILNSKTEEVEVKKLNICTFVNFRIALIPN